MFLSLWGLNITSWLEHKACFNYGELSSVLLNLNLPAIRMYSGTEQENKIKCLNKLKGQNRVILSSKYTSNSVVCFSLFFSLPVFFVRLFVSLFFVCLKFSVPLYFQKWMQILQFKWNLSYLFSLRVLMERKTTSTEVPSPSPQQFPPHLRGNHR